MSLNRWESVSDDDLEAQLAAAAGETGGVPGLGTSALSDLAAGDRVAVPAVPGPAERDTDLVRQRLAALGYMASNEEDLERELDEAAAQEAGSRVEKPGQLKQFFNQATERLYNFLQGLTSKREGRKAAPSASPEPVKPKKKEVRWPWRREKPAAPARVFEFDDDIGSEAEPTKGFFRQLGETGVAAGAFLWNLPLDALGKLRNLRLKERIEQVKINRPKIDRQKIGEFVRVHGPWIAGGLLGLSGAAVVTPEMGQAAAIWTEIGAAGVAGIGYLGLLLGSARGPETILDAESKWGKSVAAIRRLCSNSAARAAFKFLAAGGTTFAVSGATRYAIESLQAGAGTPSAAAIPQVEAVPPIEPAVGWQSADQARALGDQAAQQAQASTQFGAGGLQSSSQIQVMAEQAGREGARAAAEQTAQQAAEAARAAAEQAAQQAAVDVLRAGQTMTEMAKSMPQGTAHEAAYQILSRVSGLQNHVGEATQTILNGLRAKFGDTQGTEIFRNMTENELRMAGEYLADKLAGVPKGGLPIDNPDAKDILQAGNLSWLRAGDVASRVWDNIMTVKPTLKLALGL